MNDPTDIDSEQSRNDDSRYLEFIELLIDKSIKRLKSESFYGELRTNKPRIQDALRAIRLKDKVFKTSEVERSETHRAEKIFWDEIENIRQEELPKMYPKPEPVDLESEIKNTIFELRYQVEHGILPVKSITDLKTQNSGAFNQSRTKESQLTYHRVGRILSNMGFRKARTHTSSYAIYWDDNLLSQNGLSDFEEDEKNEFASPVSPVNPVSPVSPEIKINSESIYPKGCLPPKVSGWR